MPRGYIPPKNAVASCRLRKPIMVYGEEVHELFFKTATLRDVKGVDMGAIEKGNLDAMATLIARLADVPEPSAENIAVADIEMCAEPIGVALNPFAESGSN